MAEPNPTQSMSTRGAEAIPARGQPPISAAFGLDSAASGWRGTLKDTGHRAGVNLETPAPQITMM